jgi:hypothetical protein
MSADCRASAVAFQQKKAISRELPAAPAHLRPL